MLLIVALAVGLVCAATAASAQSSGSSSAMRFGVGTSITRINDGLLGKTAIMPLGILDFAKDSAEFGFNLRSGEDETQFMLQLGGAYFPVEGSAGQLGFGAQFNLETDAVRINNEGKSVFMFGLYAEYRAPASDSLDIGMRVFPFQLISSDNYSRFGLFSPGLVVAFFF
jgi:hypothetical protein